MGMIVGIKGVAGAGKDTMADFLVMHHNFIKLSWATPLKAAMAIMGFPEPSDREAKEFKIPGFDFTWREAVQTLGTEWGRSLDPDIWVKLACMKMLKQPDRNFVLSDVRFENESRALRNMGGKIIMLTGRQAKLNERATHASEQITADKLDIVLDNSGEVEQTQLLLQQTLGLPIKTPVLRAA